MSFKPAALRFFRELARNNSKPWFEAHRTDYERDVKAPMQALIEEMDVRFARFAPEFTGDPKRSMFRIYRDVRFSRDRSPYKTHGACWFRHRDADQRVGSEAEGGGAGYYFHVAPGASFVGGGIWMPPRPLLNRIRDGIADDHEGFERIVRAPSLRRRFGGLSDEAMLKRMPRGYPDDHPGARWLRFQSFTIGRPGSGFAPRPLRARLAGVRTPLSISDSAFGSFRQQGGRMKGVAVAVVGLGAFVTTAVAQEPMKPGPQHARIGYFAGTWQFEGEAKASPMGPGGAISGADTCRWFDGGFHLVCRGEATGPRGPLKSEAVWAYDPAQQSYTYYGYNSLGEAFYVLGNVNGKVWTWNAEMPSGDGQSASIRVTLTEESPTAYSYRFESSLDGASWMLLEEGRATKQAGAR